MRPIPFFCNLSALSMASIVPYNMNAKLIAMNYEKLIFEKLEFTNEVIMCTETVTISSKWPPNLWNFWFDRQQESVFSRKQTDRLPIGKEFPK